MDIIIQKSTETNNMPIEEIPFQVNDQSLEIFPQNLIKDKGLIYHGTSVLYSNELEENGFSTNHCPFSTESLNYLIALLADLNQPSNFDRNNPLQISFNESGSIEHFLFHLNNHPISFTNNGFAALKYATGDSKGGQIVGKIYKAIQKVRTCLNELSRDNTNRQVLEQRLFDLQDIENMCLNIQNNPGVVYAIRPPKDFYDNLKVYHMVIFSNQGIMADMIVAKTIVDFNYAIPEGLLKSVKSKVEKEFTVPNSISNYLMRKYLANDNEIDLDNF